MGCELLRNQSCILSIAPRRPDSPPSTVTDRIFTDSMRRPTGICSLETTVKLTVVSKLSQLQHFVKKNPNLLFSREFVWTTVRILHQVEISIIFSESFPWEEKKYDANIDAKLGRWSQGVNMSSQETRWDHLWSFKGIRWQKVEMIVVFKGFGLL